MDCRRTKIDGDAVIYLKGLVQRNLDAPMLNDPAAQFFYHQENRFSRQELFKLPLLDC